MKAAFTILAVLLVLGAPTTEAIQCSTTTTSESPNLVDLFSSYGSTAFPQTGDIYNNPPNPSGFSVCISYNVFGGITVVSGDRVTYTTIVNGRDGQGVLGVQCNDLINSTTGSLTRTALMYSTFRYRPAAISNFTCCTSNNCNDGLGMLFTTYLAADNRISSSILILFSSLLAFIATRFF